MTLVLILLILGFILVAAEVLLPGGILGIIALGLFIAATIVASSNFGSMAGMLVFAGAALGSLITFFGMFKFIAISPSGGGLRLDSKISGTSSSKKIDPSLIGQSGTTTTKMAPNGLVSIADNDHPAHSEDGFLDAGIRVTVHAIRNGNLVVRKTL